MSDAKGDLFSRKRSFMLQTTKEKKNEGHQRGFRKESS